MSTRLQGYGLALASVAVAAAIRYSLIPVLGNRFGFDLFLISTFVSGRYLGFGPSVLALLAGAVPVTLFQLTGPNLYDPYFAVGLFAYFTFGAIVVWLCKSEDEVRSALRQEITERKAAESNARASEAQLREQEERIRPGFCPQQIALMIRQGVPCGSGECCGPYGIPPVYVAGNNVLVRQSPEMHLKTAKLLNEMGAIVPPTAGTAD